MLCFFCAKMVDIEGYCLHCAKHQPRCNHCHALVQKDDNRVTCGGCGAVVSLADFKTTKFDCWHLAKITNDLKVRSFFDYNTIIEPQKIHEVKGKIRCCVSGLHGAQSLLDTFIYVDKFQSLALERCQIWGDIDWHDDKLAGRFRQTVYVFNFDKTFETFWRKVVALVRRIGKNHFANEFAILKNKPFPYYHLARVIAGGGNRSSIYSVLYSIVFMIKRMSPALRGLDLMGLFEKKFIRMVEREVRRRGIGDKNHALSIQN